MRKISFEWMVMTLAMILSVACKEDGAADPCKDYEWTTETPGEIVCPMTDECACLDGDLCCVDIVENEVHSAACASASSCSGLAFACDGPEDCGGDTVCCAVAADGGGSSCEDASSCADLDGWIMCRATADCPDDGECEAAGEGAYFEELVGFCAYY